MWDILFVAVVTVVFTADAIVCTKEALAFGRSPGGRPEAAPGSGYAPVQTALLRMDAEDRLHETRTDLETRLAGRRADLEARLEELRPGPEKPAGRAPGKSESQLLELLKEKEASLAAIRERRRKFLRFVLRSNPTASSRRYKDEFRT